MNVIFGSVNDCSWILNLCPCCRFDGAKAPKPEWQAFGSYCFLLPLLEYLESADGCILSCTVAWDIPNRSLYTVKNERPMFATSNSNARDFSLAAANVVAALDLLLAPATLAKGQFDIRRWVIRHFWIS